MISFFESNRRIKEKKILVEIDINKFAKAKQRYFDPDVKFARAFHNAAKKNQIPEDKIKR